MMKKMLVDKIFLLSFYLTSNFTQKTILYTLQEKQKKAITFYKPNFFHISSSKPPKLQKTCCANKKEHQNNIEPPHLSYSAQ
jgi:hypothetical protein